MAFRWTGLGALGLVMLLLAGCAHSSGDLCLIHPGCSRSMVRQHLGKPSFASANGNVEIYRYDLITPRGGLTLPQPEAYYVRIVDGSVEGYGKWSELPASQ